MHKPKNIKTVKIFNMFCYSHHGRCRKKLIVSVLITVKKTVNYYKESFVFGMGWGMFNI